VHLVNITVFIGIKMNRTLRFYPMNLDLLPGGNFKNYAVPGDVDSSRGIFAAW